MSIFFTKEPPSFDEYGKDDDGWTREDHKNLATYGTKAPTQEMIEEQRKRVEKEPKTGRWF